MTPEYIASLIVFAGVTSVTPGPNNVMLLASGATFGLRRTLPQLLGVTFGFSTVILATGVGLGALLQAQPWLQVTLKLIAGVYMLYLSWRIATAGGQLAIVDQSRPVSFLESAVFQWVNPKAWVVAASTIAVYISPADPLMSLVPVLAIFVAVNLPSIGLWAGMGTVLRQRLANVSHLRIFNTVMGVLLAMSIVPILAT